MNNILFDIYILVPSLQGKAVEISEIMQLETINQDAIFNDPRGVFCHARFRYGKMRCWVYHEYLMKVFNSCLASMPFVLDGKHYFSWSEWNEKFDVVFQSYDEQNIMVYVADKDTYSDEDFMLNKEYNIVMRPLVLTKSWGIRIPNTHKIVIMPKYEFYKITYKKAIYIKNIFTDIGYQKEFYIYDNALDKVQKKLEDLGLI